MSLNSCHTVSVQSLWTLRMKQWQSLDQDMVTHEISAQLIQAMDSLCKQCGISSDHIINSTFEYIDDNVHSIIAIYYTSYFVYSSPEGNVTASTLVTFLQHWLLEAEENEMQVTVGEAHLVLYKLCSLTKNSPDSKRLCLTTWSTKLHAALLEILPDGTKTRTLTPCPVESHLNDPRTFTSAVMAAGIFVGGMMLAGSICSVIAALSWSAKLIT